MCNNAIFIKFLFSQGCSVPLIVLNNYVFLITFIFFFFIAIQLLQSYNFLTHDINNILNE